MAAPPELWAKSPYRKGRVVHYYRRKTYWNGTEQYESICGICGPVHPTLFRLEESRPDKDKCPQCERALERHKKRNPA